MQSLARRAGRMAQQMRGFAAQAEVVSAEQSPFLRFGSPFPAQINYNPVLAQLPETKVRFWCRSVQSTSFGALPSALHSLNPVPGFANFAGDTPAQRHAGDQRVGPFRGQRHGGRVD